VYKASTKIGEGERMFQPGVFTISLDFELYWGMRDTVRFEDYRGNLLGAREVIPRLLTAFVGSGIHVTWATVGFLFFDRKEELLASLPEVRPTYTNPRLSPYPDLAANGASEREDPYRYALSLVREIAAHPGQEIGTHTFCHYYCCEDGQTAEAFRADMAAAVAAAARLGLTLRSLVFPKNQCNPDYLEICRGLGIIAYRGVERSWLHEPGAATAQRALAKRVGRILDQYVNLTGDNDSVPTELDPRLPVNLPSSRFLRPTAPRWRHLDRLRLHRICTGMTQAARRGTAFHLWWHPHNFGAAQDANLALLERVLAHYRQLADRYGMVSRNMAESALAVIERAPSPATTRST
jgi:hypothetical protein